MRTPLLVNPRVNAGSGARRIRRRAAAVCAILLGLAAPALAQLDPLLFLKATKPNVLLVVDTADRMQRDADHDYYDQFIYSKTGVSWETTLGVTAANTNRKYRRKYVKLRNLDMSVSPARFGADTIAIVGDLQSGFSTFDARTRLAVARTALVRAIQLNETIVRFGLIKTRQINPAPGAPDPVGSQLGNDGPVRVDDPNLGVPTDLADGAWRVMRPTVTSPNGLQTPVAAPVHKADGASANSDILTLLAKSPEQGGLVPAGRDSSTMVDAPVKYMLDDAKAEATRLIGSDTACRNTVVVLVVGGAEGNTSGQDPASAASSFKTISSRRVPIYVIAIAPPAGDVRQLQAIAANSGGQYLEITKAMIDAVTPGSPVPEFVRAVNTAVQHTFASYADFNMPPTSQLPYGPSTEYQVASPIVGTVNLANTHDINGHPLPNSVITKGIDVVPQRSNVMVTTGFALPGPVTTPGFPGRLRAFRVYRPVPDAAASSGFRFVGDGTPLWIARAPAAGEGPRNIYTALPNGTMIRFAADNAGALQPYLNDDDAAGLISSVGGLPLGAFVDSTPAFLDAPSLDPPPDADYAGFRDACARRRTMLFIGGNDGMLHAIDARSGVEVWAFIPPNLLPKLRALREGQPVEQFRFFVDGSPKLADVKVGGKWRTYVVFGEGPGGTFYQAIDVTMADMPSRIAPDSDDIGAVLAYFASTPAITLRWSFPDYGHFNYTLRTTVTPYGDLDKDLATAIEKSVGQTWSAPAIGQVLNGSGSWVVLVGSGFLPYSQQRQANRGEIAAGTTFYVIDIVNGAVLDSRNVGNDGKAETVDNCAAANDCTQLKNALQADPVATGPPGSRFVDTAYIGDLDGRLWRVGLGLSGSGTPSIAGRPATLFDATAAQPLFSSLAVVEVGGTQQYIFFGGGSNRLPSNGVSQSYNLYGVRDTHGAGAQVFVFPLETTEGANGGEKVSAYPAVAGDIVFFTTTTSRSATFCTPPDAALYAFTLVGGPAYDNTDDNMVDRTDTPRVKTFSGAGRATPPFVADRHLLLAVGGKAEVFGDPQGFNNGVGQARVRILSWREIR